MSDDPALRGRGDAERLRHLTGDFVLGGVVALLFQRNGAGEAKRFRAQVKTARSWRDPLRRWFTVAT